MSPKKIVKRTNVTWTKCHLENFIRKKCHQDRCHICKLHSQTQDINEKNFQWHVSDSQLEKCHLKNFIRRMSPGQMPHK